MYVRAVRVSPPAALALFLALVAGLLGVLARPRGAGRGPAPRALVPDLNRAPERHLLLLPGIGPVRARAIVEEREAGGSFQSLGDLGRVRGIGPATTEAVAAFVSLGHPREGDP